MDQRRVTILGCGYGGRAAIAPLRAAGYGLTVTTTSPDKLPGLTALLSAAGGSGADRAQVAHGDDPNSVARAIADSHAVILTVGAKGKDDYRRAYLQTAQTLVALVPHHPQIQQIIYTGSYVVYGDRDGAWVDEDTPPQPANPNGEILLATEQTLAAIATPERRVCIFRLGGICGPGREIVKIFRTYAGTTRPGSGGDWSNWIHLDDIVGAIAFALERRLDGIYNLVHDRPETQKDLLERTFHQHGLDPVNWNPTEAGPLRPYNARVSNEKLKAAGYRFRHATIPI